ncbi:MAG: hypothetical protein IJ452_05450 [Butyricicoccus sp.]|nr:hypothetical protein [Butyricicoccus sp.]
MHISFEAVAGNSALKQDLRTALAQRFPQTVLLCDPSGISNEPLAEALASALLCTGTNPPCGGCAACIKLRADSHPDLIVIDEGDSEIKVDTARQIRDEAYIRPNEGGRKVFLIRHADRMNPIAQNALLKVLEEPPRDVFFVLTAMQPGVILQTIRSRCSIYHLEPPTDELPDDAVLDLLAPFLRAMTERDEYRMAVAAQNLSKMNKAEFRAAMALLTTALRDAILAASAPEIPPLLPRLQQETQALGRRIPTKKLLGVTTLCAALRERASRNASSFAQCTVLAAGAYKQITD